MSNFASRMYYFWSAQTFRQHGELEQLDICAAVNLFLNDNSEHSAARLWFGVRGVMRNNSFPKTCGEMGTTQRHVHNTVTVVTMAAVSAWVTHTLSHSLFVHGIKARPQLFSLSSVCLYFPCTPGASVCFMNPRGGGVVRLRRGRGSPAEKIKEKGRRRRALVVLKAVEIHWAADIPILSSTAWKDRKGEMESIKYAAVYYNTLHICCM